MNVHAFARLIEDEYGAYMNALTHEAEPDCPVFPQEACLDNDKRNIVRTGRGQ